MAQKGRAAIKSKFITGAKPTQQDFADLIDSTLVYLDDGNPFTVVTSETLARIAADAVVQASVTAEATARVDGDTNVAASVNDEATIRASADTALQVSITAESTARIATDTALQASITAESAARAAALAAVQGTVTTETAARVAADAAVQASVTAEATARASADTALTAALASKQATLGYVPFDAANVDTDATLAANSDTRVPSQKAIKAYVLANAGSGGGPVNAVTITTLAHAGAVKALLVQDDTDTPLFQVSDNGAFSLGPGLVLPTPSDVLIGQFSSITTPTPFNFNIAMGAGVASGAGSIAIGAAALAVGDGLLSIGRNARAIAGSTYSTAVGFNSTVNGDGCVCIGATQITEVMNNIPNSVMFHMNGSITSDLSQSFFVNRKSNVVLKSLVSLAPGTDFDAAATNTHTLANGTPPAGPVAHATQIYSANSGAGLSTLALYTEQALVAETVTSGHTYTMKINGVDVKFLCE